MSLHQPLLSNENVVSCSHCNSNDDGPEAGICHNGLDRSRACKTCLKIHNTKTGNDNIGLFKAVTMVAAGYLSKIPCSFCDGKGYRKI